MPVTTELVSAAVVIIALYCTCVQNISTQSIGCECVTGYRCVNIHTPILYTSANFGVDVRHFLRAMMRDSRETASGSLGGYGIIEMYMYTLMYIA